MARYKAIWTYSGEVKASCSASSLPDFAKAMCHVYAHVLGDDFWMFIFVSRSKVSDFYVGLPYGVPTWQPDAPKYPLFLFGSETGEDVLCNPSASEIIRYVAGKSGGYDVRITGFYDL